MRLALWSAAAAVWGFSWAWVWCSRGVGRCEREHRALVLAELPAERAWLAELARVEVVC